MGLTISDGPEFSAYMNSQNIHMFSKNMIVYIPSLR